MSYILFGGSFNPIHYGHLFLAEELHVGYGYEKIIFIPSNKPVHKPEESKTTASQRIDMIKLAVEGIPWIEVEECEVKRGGYSYTVDTLRDLYSRYKFKEKPGFVIGDDLAYGFPRWKDPEAILSMVNLVVAKRGSGLPKDFSYPYTAIDNLRLAISSSEIRERVKSGKAFRFLLPEKVYDYVKYRGLYIQ